jgi:hypothetical protein
MIRVQKAAQRLLQLISKEQAHQSRLLSKLSIKPRLTGTNTTSLVCLLSQRTDVQHPQPDSATLHIVGSFARNEREDGRVGFVDRAEWTS